MVEIRDAVVMGLLVLLSVAAFAIWLEARRERVASERRTSFLEAILVHVAARSPAEPHQSMLVPQVAAPEPDTVRPGWGARKPVEVTRDSDPETLGPCKGRSFPALPNLGEDDDTLLMGTRVSPGTPRRTR